MTVTWYSATTPSFPPCPVLEQDLTCDVCIIGAGFTGVTAALALAEAGFATVVLEAGRLGENASGRNGGQIVSAYNLDMRDIVALVGQDDAQRLWQLSEEAKALVRERIRRHDISCSLSNGMIYGAVKFRHLEDIETWQREWSQEYSYPHLRILDQAEMHTKVDSPAFLGGLLDAGGGQLQPLNYLLGLATAAQKVGVRIFEHSRVTRIETSAHPSATTRGGRVHCRWLVVATNGGRPSLTGSLATGVVPVLTQVGVTECLGEDTVHALLPGNLPVCDMNFMLSYFRRTPDHRILIGGGVRLCGTPTAPPDRILKRRLLRAFPSLSSAKMEICWSERLALTRNRLPQLGRLGPTTLFAHGYSGHGIALTTLAGTLIAETIAGHAERFDVFVRIPHQPFPRYRLLQVPMLALAMAWHRLLDVLP